MIVGRTLVELDKPGRLGQAAGLAAVLGALSRHRRRPDAVRMADTPLVTRSRALGTVRNFLETYDLGFAVERPNREHTVDVLWSNIRFCRRADPADLSMDAPLPVIALGGGVRGTCALWFGGTYDSEGRALRQVVRVGGWLQTRRVEP